MFYSSEQIPFSVNKNDRSVFWSTTGMIPKDGEACTEGLTCLFQAGSSNQPDVPRTVLFAEFLLLKEARGYVTKKAENQTNTEGETTLKIR